MVLDRPDDWRGVLAYVEQVLIPTLEPDDIVVMDNLPAHKTACCPPPQSPPPARNSSCCRPTRPT